MKTPATREHDTDTLATLIEDNDAGYVREALGKVYHLRDFNPEYSNAISIGIRRLGEMIGATTTRIRIVAAGDNRAYLNDLAA